MADPAHFRPRLILLGLAAAAIAATACFMTIGARGDWGFVLAFRGTKLAGIVLVGTAIAISTVLFQAVAQNRILTPAVMGFDSLYVAIQTGLVFLFGAAGIAGLDPRLLFLFETAAMLALSMLLFRLFFSGDRRSLHLMVLAGIVFGIFFRSLSHLLQRILAPNEFSLLQDMLFASFNTVDPKLLVVAGAALAIATLPVFRINPTLDVLALGRETAIGLGVEHRRLVSLLLLSIAVLVSVSTALVGPVTFLGLLVASLARELLGTGRHRYVMPASILLSIVALVGGQTILERGLGLDGALGMVVEFIGGIAFIVLILKGAR